MSEKNRIWKSLLELFMVVFPLKSELHQKWCRAETGTSKSPVGRISHAPFGEHRVRLDSQTAWFGSTEDQRRQTRVTPPKTAPLDPRNKDTTFMFGYIKANNKEGAAIAPVSENPPGRNRNLLCPCEDRTQQLLKAAR